MTCYRSAVVDQSERWLGLKATNKSNSVILSTYNANKPLPRGYKVKATDNWCATFASAVFIAVGYKSIFPKNSKFRFGIRSYAVSGNKK